MQAETLYRKMVGENGDDNILTKQYFPRAHTEERKEWETGLIPVGANSNQVVGVEREQHIRGF